MTSRTTLRTYPFVLIAGVLAMTAALSAESPMVLTVRVYNSSGIASADLDLAREVAGPILRETGVEVTFRSCGRPSAESTLERCNDALKPSEVVVRLIDAPRVDLGQGPDVLGIAYVVPETKSGWLATLYADRITAKASRNSLERGLLLGRVMAHEVGHLLLGPHYHGETGVMRRDWPEALLHDSDDAAWRFSSSELSVMVRALASR